MRWRRLIPLLLVVCVWAVARFVVPDGGSAIPPAPSLAGKVSAARQHFLARVDSTCARSYNAGHARQARYADKVARRPDANVLVTAFYVRIADVQALEQRALALKAEGNRLGQRFGLRICSSNGPR